jgi:hemerythrin-like domain-containing protein
MKPVEMLSAEHRVIEIMLGCMERMAERVESGGGFHPEHARQAVDFIRNFADKCHHGKEEDRLFPAMVSKGVPNESGPIGVMLLEHEQGRSYVAAMAKGLELFDAGEEGGRDSFLFAAGQYVELLRAHIAKEDQILFPLANRIMNDADHAILMNQFDLVEREHMGAGTHEKYLKIAEELGKEYGIDTSAIAAAPATGSCGCSHHR